LSIIYLTDRSRVDTREECPRKRYLNYDFEVDGALKGVQRVMHSLPLLNGTEIHEAHAQVLMGEDLDTVVAAMRVRYRAQVEARGVFNEADPEGLISEQLNLLEAMLRAFVALWMPRILDEFTIVGIETPLDWALAPGLVQKLRFDVTARRKSDNQLVIIDFKSMDYLSDVWALKLEVSNQTSLYVEAAEELYGEPVEMAYLAMLKGSWRKDTARSSPFYEQKIQASPYLYAYAIEGNGMTIYQTAYTPKKGYRKVRTYDEMTVKEWVKWLLDNERQMVNDLFVWNPPIAPTLKERHDVRELVIKEELEYVSKVRQYHAMRDEAVATGNEVLAHKAEKFLDVEAAPKRRNTCFKYGNNSQCAFYGVCFNGGALEGLLDDPTYEVREPHHGTEAA
jgi:PD-(D/E)XK nuclease superfamily